MEKDVPYIVYEAVIARFERTIKRLVIALVIGIILLFASNMAWLWFFNQFEYAEESRMVTIDSHEGTANYVGNDGDIINGENSSGNGAAADAEEEPQE